MPAGAALHPLSDFLRPWFPEGRIPRVVQLNDEACRRAIVTGSGAPLSFVAPNADVLGYEERAFMQGEVATRPDNFHDLFNALIWLCFPQTKAALNARHVQVLREAAQSQPLPVRGPVRDAITQFDECGVIVVGMSLDLQQALRAHRWREVFVERRAEVQQTTRFVLFGHASHDALRAPFIGLCGKALFLDLPGDSSLEEIDAALKRHVASASALHPCGNFSPRDWQPLPLLGIPGATTDNESPDYYDDTRQFRPARTMRAGSSPGNR